VRVLAHLQDLDFAALQFDIRDRHLFFGHNLDSDIFAGFFVDSSLNEAELSFSERILDLVEVKQVRLSDDLL
jgi:hypothetical protein